MKTNELLHILERDARTSVADLAAMTGRTEDDVRAAVREYEAQGTIRSYKTRVDWDKAGEPRVFAFIDVSAHPERGRGYDRIAERIARSACSHDPAEVRARRADSQERHRCAEDRVRREELSADDVRRVADDEVCAVREDCMRGDREEAGAREQLGHR